MTPLRRILRAAGYDILRSDVIENLQRHRSPDVPPGHFYSPYPDVSAIRANEAQIFNTEPPVLGVNFREAQQLAVLKELSAFYPSIEFPEEPTDGWRFYYRNPMYAYSDAIVLNGMIRRLQPHRIVEIGSGFSSAVMLDTVERHMTSPVELTFIEPYPERLYSLMTAEDRQKHRVLVSSLQSVDASIFETLEAGDILFIDSTHVVKVDSDVNRLFFEILPRLPAGVHVHVHDIFYPFEYPREWVYEGRAWQELYLLRAFLQYNDVFSIEYFQQFMFRRHHAFFSKHMPLCLKNPGGNIWLRRVR